MAQLGMVGLGRMGANLVRRLMRDGHDCVVYDVNPDAVEALAGEGADRRRLARDLAAKLEHAAGGLGHGPGRRDHREDRRTSSPSVLESGDAIIDGGNSYYRDDIRRAAKLARAGDRLHRLRHQRRRLRPRARLLPDDRRARRGGRAARPDLRDARARASTPPSARPGRDGRPAPAENGYLHCGPSGAGHFVKMVHNGIEYGLMAAYAEGLNILKNANAGKVEREADAETAPLEHPEYYQYDLDIPEVAEVWRRGSVVGSWLLDLTAAALQESPDLADFAGRVSDSGEGRWTSIAAIDEGVPAPVLTTALYARFASRDLDDFADKVLSAMRKQFGGHDEKK